MENSDYLALIEDNLKSTEAKLIDFVVRGEKKNKILEIYIDSEAGLNLETISTINRNISKLVDEFQAEKGTNEISKIMVSSPGVDKPFKFAWQLYKHIGREIDITMNDGEKISGILELLEPNDTLVIEEIKKKKSEPAKDKKIIKFSDIKDSRIKLKF
jgi:ribosome maturation factor RimP